MSSREEGTKYDHKYCRQNKNSNPFEKTRDQTITNDHSTKQKHKHRDAVDAVHHSHVKVVRAVRVVLAEKVTKYSPHLKEITKLTHNLCLIL